MSSNSITQKPALNSEENLINNLSSLFSSGELALLETAAKRTRISLADFVRREAIEAAEADMLERRIIVIPAENWDRIKTWSDAPPRNISALCQPSTIRPSGTTRSLTGDDDRYAFDCGRDSLNRWFWHHAWANQETDITRTHVSIDPATSDILGYVSLSLAEIKCDPQPCEGTAPNDRAAALPAILLSRFAIDQRYQRLGHARSLMRFVFMSAESVSKNIGCFCILTHPLDDQVRAFFSTFGFEDIPGDPAGGMAIRLIDLENRISE